MTLEIEHLHRLANTSNAQDHQEQQRKRTKSSFKHLECDVRLNRSVRIDRFHKQRRGDVRTTIQQTAISVEASGQTSLSELRKYLRPLQDLVTFATQRPRGILSLEVTELRRGVERELQIYFDGLVAPDAKKGSEHNFLFGFGNLSFATIGRKWIGLCANYQVPINMLMGLIYWSSGPLESRVLTAVAAAESYHRLAYPARAMPKRDHDKILAAVDTLSPTLQRWTRDRLRNEPSLKERLLDLAARLEPSAREEVLPDAERWAAVAKRYRNNIAHGLRLTDSEKAGEALAVITVTSAVLSLLVLARLGVPSDEIAHVVREHPQFRDARRLAWLHLRAADNNARGGHG